MLNLEEVRLKDRKQALYIPILDRNPSYAARSLTKKDLLESYGILSRVFTDIKEGKESFFSIVQDSVMDSEENFLWFASLYKEMEKALDVAEPTELPFKECPKRHSITKSPKFQPPFKVIKDSKARLYKIKYLKNVASQSNPINNYRASYVMRQYNMEDFQNGVFPSWYLLSTTVIFEQYNERTNTRVKIDFMHGEFRYYIAGASDNWDEIVDVPLEMDHVVSALLFRHYRLD